MNFYFLIDVSLYLAFLALFAVLAVLTVFVRDTTFISANPILFSIELILLPVFASAALMVFYLTRGIDMGRALSKLAVATGCIVTIHVLLQLSGYYAVWGQS